MEYNNKTQEARRKYLEGLSLSKEEQERIDKDLSGNDFRFFISDDSSFILPDKYNEESTYQLIEKQIGQNTSIRRIPFIRYIGYAAAILIIALFSTITYNYLKQPEILYVSTSYGEKKEVTLPDGSLIILNSMSSITYPEKMNGEIREVSLQGEAYFDVAKKTNKAFIVKADNVEVKVLGTKFNIDAYENQEHITTTLFEGIVSVGLHGNTVQKLNPGEQAVFSKTSEELKILQLENTDGEEAWRNNMLVFENIPLSDILNTLSREHNVTFDIDSENLKQLHITARFNSTLPVDTALAILGKSAEFKYTKQNNIYKITVGK